MDKSKIKLKELTSSSAEEFIEYLQSYASDKLSSVVCGFSLRAPVCLYDMTGLEAKHIIAFGPGARTRDGVTNAVSISVEQVRMELIQEAAKEIPGAMSEDAKENLAKAKLWPVEEKSIRERDRGNFNKEVDALFAYAENRMAQDIRSILDSDETYQRAKANRCVVGFLETLRAKCAVGINNAQANREAIERQLRELKMENKLESYLDYKQKFMKLTNSLRKCIDVNDWNEEDMANKFLSKLDQNIFMNIFYQKIGPENSCIKGANTIDTALKYADVIYDALKTANIMTGTKVDQLAEKDKSEKDKAGTINQEANIFHANEAGNKRSAAKMSKGTKTEAPS